MKKLDLNLSLKIILFVVIVVCLILVAFIIKANTNTSFKINKYNKDGISFNYDNTFKLTNKKEYIELVTSDNSAVVAISKKDYSYDLNDLEAESISYQVTQEDGTYNKIYSNYEDDKYYFLYENYDTGKQIEVVEIQKDDYLYLIVFEAKSDEFDLYQESFKIIVNSFKV